MLTELCAELKNYFIRDQYEDIHSGTFTISGGSIDLPFLLDGQHFRIVGSALNDGVYKHPATGLADETFEGAVWAMAVPPSVVALAAEIKAWDAQHAAALNAPYQSESFDGYSRTLKTGGESGGAYTWRNQFAARLNPYRRLFVL